ncbi:hypothetical protein HDU76_011074 [Blyttiomyces sp. JEL0837]|nr:hypothetical protein HDU76_011074 [Blyttiomyces sp. JEL0837]
MPKTYAQTRWCESRGDVAGYGASQTFMAFTYLMSGEEFGETDSTLLKLCYEPNNFDPIFSPATITLIFQRHLLSNNLERLPTCIEQARKLFKQSLKSLVWASPLNFLEAYFSITEGDLKSSIAFFQTAVTNTFLVDRIMVTPMELFWFSSIFIWLIIECERTGLPHCQNVKHTEETRQELIKALQDACRLAKYFYEKIEIYHCYWALGLFEAGLAVMKGGNGMAQVAKMLLRRAYKTSGKRKKRELEELKWCESRGDVAGYGASQTFMAFTYFMSGEGFGETESTLVRLSYEPNYFDPAWSPATMTLLFRRHLLSNNLERLSKCIEQARKLFKQSLQSLVLASPLTFLESYYAITQGDLKGSIAFFQTAVTNAFLIDRFLVTPMESLWMSSIFVWLIIECERCELPNCQNVTHTEETRRDMIRALQDACRLAQYLYAKIEIYHCYWAFGLFEAGLAVMKGR